MSRLTLLLVSCFLAVNPVHGQASPEQRAARYMESVRQKPGLLLAFLREMPKGGDLHNHLTGAVYAESCAIKLLLLLLLDDYWQYYCHSRES